MNYSAPEFINNQNQTKKVDIWSLGCIIYKLFANKMAFSGRNRFSVIDKIRQCSYDEEILETLNPKIKDLIKSCIVKNPEERLNITQVK